MKEIEIINMYTSLNFIKRKFKIVIDPNFFWPRVIKIRKII